MHYMTKNYVLKPIYNDENEYIIFIYILDYIMCQSHLS